MSEFGRLHALLIDDDTLAQVGQDLPESACREPPRDYGVHVVSRGLTKVGEGLPDPKLVLAWLLDAIGTPTWALAILVTKGGAIGCTDEQSTLEHSCRRGGFVYYELASY